MIPYREASLPNNLLVELIKARDEARIRILALIMLWIDTWGDEAISSSINIKT